MIRWIGALVSMTLVALILSHALWPTKRPSSSLSHSLDEEGEEHRALRNGSDGGVEVRREQRED